ncbi:MAG: G1 family glutamic endopeptidase [Candidatus Sulfotelmatobacter sp.]
MPTNWPGVYAFTQPPADFDPLTASQEELASWGYPPRPNPAEGPRALARWSEEVNPALQRQIPDLVKSEGVYHRQVIDLVVKSQSSKFKSVAANSSNWSGYVLVPASGGQPFSSVSARWTLPTVKQAPGSCSGGWDYSSQWVGIGGVSDAFLLQAGSAADVFCDLPGNNIAEYFPWLEWLPESELVLYQNAKTNTLFPFAPGDYLIVTISATKFSGGVSTNGTLSFADVTQGWSVALAFTAASVGGSEVTGKSAEWIVERTEVNGSLATLPDYFANPWWDTTATDLGAVVHYPGAAGTATVYDFTMLDNSSAPVSFVDLFGKDALWFFPEGSATK